MNTKGNARLTGTVYEFDGKQLIISSRNGKVVAIYDGKEVPECQPKEKLKAEMEDMLSGIVPTVGTLVMKEIGSYCHVYWDGRKWVYICIPPGTPC